MKTSDRRLVVVALLSSVLVGVADAQGDPNMPQIGTAVNAGTAVLKHSNAKKVACNQTEAAQHLAMLNLQTEACAKRMYRAHA